MNKLQPISSVLEEKDLSQLQRIGDEISDAWDKNQIFRTETEARYAVLNDFKFPTKAAKYWQAVREQMVHFNELTTLSFDIRRKEIDLRENEEKRASASGFELDRLNVDRDELLYSLASAKRVAKDRVREVMQWSQIKKEVNDGSFDDKDVNAHQKESLFKSVLNRAQVAPKDISAEERLSIDGLLNGLKDVPENKKLIEQIQKAQLEKKAK